MAAWHTKASVWLGLGVVVAALVLAASLRRERGGLISISGAGTVEIPTASIEAGQARFFVYHARGGGETRLIVARDDQGRVQAVLDACGRCYPYHRGYSAEHSVLTCNYCANRYKIGAIAHGMAGCEPVKIPFQIAGQTIRIEVAELERESKLF
jgi:uncharacterized membrane protein